MAGPWGGRGGRRARARCAAPGASRRAYCAARKHTPEPPSPSPPQVRPLNGREIGEGLRPCVTFDEPSRQVVLQVRSGERLPCHGAAAREQRRSSAAACAPVQQSTHRRSTGRHSCSCTAASPQAYQYRQCTHIKKNHRRSTRRRSCSCAAAPPRASPLTAASAPSRAAMTSMTRVWRGWLKTCSR